MPYGIHNSPTEKLKLPFQIFPLQEAVEVDTVKVVSKRRHTQIVMDQPEKGSKTIRTKELGSAIQGNKMPKP